MDVWIVIGVDWEDYEIDSVWDNEEEAEARCEKKNKSNRHYIYHVDTWMVNGARET
jgi:hypothetical protein